MRLAVMGASGRMGRAIVRLAHAEGIEVVCAIGTTDVGRDVGELAGIGPTGTCVVDRLDALAKAGASVVVDFSSPDATQALAPMAASAGIAIASGTTGLHPKAREALDRAAQRVAVVWEPNTSVGVHVLTQLVAQASGLLADWDVEIVEVHHNAKRDAPSGTALRLAEAIAGTAESAGRHLVRGRSGVAPRTAGEIGVHAVRGGDVVGDHTVYFLRGAERIELTHRATTRDVFADGALRIAQWLEGKPAGRYSMRDVLAQGPLAR